MELNWRSVWKSTLFIIATAIIASACSKGTTDVTAHYSLTSSTSKDHLGVIVDGQLRGKISGGYGYFNAPVAVPSQTFDGPSTATEITYVTIVVQNYDRGGMISVPTQCSAGNRITTNIRYEISSSYPSGQTSCTSSY